MDKIATVKNKVNYAEWISMVEDCREAAFRSEFGVKKTSLAIRPTTIASGNSVQCLSKILWKNCFLRMNRGQLYIRKHDYFSFACGKDSMLGDISLAENIFVA